MYVLTTPSRSMPGVSHRQHTLSLTSQTLAYIHNKNQISIYMVENKNYHQLIKQAKVFKVKNIIISDDKIYQKIKKNNKYKNINIYKDFGCFRKVFKKKNRLYNEFDYRN